MFRMTTATQTKQTPRLTVNQPLVEHGAHFHDRTRISNHDGVRISSHSDGVRISSSRDGVRISSRLGTAA